MENLIYNELRVRGFNVDVGVVPVVTKDKDGKQQRSNLEVDFICNLGSRRYYIQSAYRMESEEKENRNVHPCLKLMIHSRRLSSLEKKALLSETKLVLRL